MSFILQLLNESSIVIFEANVFINLSLLDSLLNDFDISISVWGQVILLSSI